VSVRVERLHRRRIRNDSCVEYLDAADFNEDDVEQSWLGHDPFGWMN
jgi:hypothetical protein